MVHELTHLHEGDTASGALLGPKLHRFDIYTELMSQNLATLIVFYPLCLYRMLFELAWQRNSREREFVADRNASALVSSAAIIESLIKISAYAHYRGEVERTLFEQGERHKDKLEIQQAIAAGLPAHVNSPDFISALREQNVPHPFDSHPPLLERMANVAFSVAETDYAAIAAQQPDASWVDLIPVAGDIELRFWQEYERDFSSSHEESLAWRYRPLGEAETAIVLKYFPDAPFALKNGAKITVTWQGIIHPKTAELVAWDNVKNININRGFGGEILYVQHLQPNAQGKKRTRIPLPGMKEELQAFKITLNLYWHRHQTAIANITPEPALTQ